MTRILIIGSGQLGSRHLQAVAALPQVCEVEVVDPNPVALNLGKERLGEIIDRQKNIEYRWCQSLDQASKGGNLCIVATQAKGRGALVQQVANTLGYGSFLLEKIVTQSVREYEELLNFSETRKLSVWVNCKARAYLIHKYIKSRLNPSEPILFNSLGGNHGLGNNGVHAADLFVFYDGCKKIESAGSQVDPILHPSKRGPAVFDLSGTLHGITQRGSHFTLSYAKDHVNPDHTSIVTKSYRVIVDHFRRWAMESDGADGGGWRSVAFEGNLAVSNMTKDFATDILTKGRCELPTLRDCFPAHQFVLSELLPHFNRFLNKKDDRCPVT